MAKISNPFKITNPFKPFNIGKETKKEHTPHIITEYEKQLIRDLCPAIKNKQLLRFWYNDKTSKFKDWRLIEPHFIGQTNFKSANIWLVGWFLPTINQLEEGHEEGWGNYILDDVSKIEILNDKYRYTRPQYNKNDKRMSTIYCATS